MQHRSDWMNKIVLNRIKRAVKLGLDEKASRIIESQHAYLSKRDYRSLMACLITHDKYPCGLISHICYKSSVFELSCARMAYIMARSCFAGYTATVRMFLTDNRIDPTYNNYCCMRYACLKGHTEVVRILLEDGRIDPTVCQDELKGVCRNGFTSIVRLFLKDRRIDPSIRDNASLDSASWYGNVDIVRILLEDDRVLRCDMWHAVENAKTTRHLAIADMIVRAGAVKTESKFVIE